MKKLISAVLASLMLLLTAVPAYADAALPRRYSYAYYVASKWIIAIIVAVVIVAAAIIIMAVKYRREQNAADAAKAAARAAGEREPEDK